MRSRSDTWKTIVANGDFQMETVVRIYGATGTDASAIPGVDSVGAYREYNSITAPIITRNLLGGDTLSVGNCAIGTLNFSILTTDNIPKSARIVVRSRPHDGDVYAEWMDFGTFWIDERSTSDDLTTITAYDSMKMGNQVYSDDSITRNWPKAIKTVVTRIAEQMGVFIDSRTTAQVINSSVGDSMIVLKPNDNDSLLDILGRIGGVVGGNWTITTDNKLRYVPITTIPENTNYIIDNGSEYNYISTESGNAIIWADNESGSGDAVDGDMFNIPVIIGSLSVGRQYSVSKVTMSIDDEHIYSYGNTTGFELVIENNPYATPGMCKSLYNTMSGVVYAPFSIENACYDPAAELGDGLVINTQEPIASILFNEVRTFDVKFRADASAPNNEETESEYPYKTAWQRMKYEIQDATTQLGRELRSEISQTQTEIMQTVSDVYVTKENSDLVELSTYSKIAQRADSIVMTVAKNFSTKSDTAETRRELKSTIDQTAESITLSVSENYTTKNETGEVRTYLESKITQTAGSIRLSVSQIDSRLGEAESELRMIPGEMEAKVSKNGVIAAINLSAQGEESNVKISADRINLEGYATFSALGAEGGATTKIHGSNIQTGTLTVTSLDTSTQNKINSASEAAEEAKDAAERAEKAASEAGEDAVAREQYIYISKPNGTTSQSANTTWVTDATGNQNTWTSRRPEYSSSYPVLFVAQQSQTLKQKNTSPGTTCSCTTPMIDQTTTVIDGGKIITGSITTEKMSAHTINADRLTGSISNSGWQLDFQTGTFTIGNISANKINSGTISASRIGPLDASKITTGYVGDSAGWGLNFTNGTLNIGNISADKITAGTLDADNVVIRGGYDTLDVSGSSGIEISGGKLYIRLNSQSTAFNRYGMIRGQRSPFTDESGVEFKDVFGLFTSANMNICLNPNPTGYIYFATSRIYVCDANGNYVQRGYTGTIASDKSINVYNGIIVGYS